jgi:hypothetical protein
VSTLAEWMVAGPDAYRWSLEVLNRQLTGTYRLPLDEYPPKVLDALLNHLPDALKRKAIQRAQDADFEETRETGDPEWDEMERAIRAGVDPATLPSWQKNGGAGV